MGLKGDATRSAGAEKKKKKLYTAAENEVTCGCTWNTTR